MTNVFDKKETMLKCEKCENVIDVTMHSEYQKMRVQNHVLREENEALRKNERAIRAQKVGQTQGLHLVIKHLLNLMTEEQREKALKETQQMRNTIKHITK